MKFRLNDHPYAFLVHHEKLCNPKMSALQLLVHLLDDIVYYVKDILHEDFYFEESFNFTNIKNINLLVGGGTPTEHNNIRQAFGLLINRDQLISNIILDLFKGNEDYQYLINNLFNNTKILNATSYLQSPEELYEERSTFYFLLI
jgi:hypothetical protein